MSGLPATIGPIDIYRTIYKDGPTWTARAWLPKHQTTIYGYGDTPEHAFSDLMEELRRTLKECKETSDE